MQKNIQFIYQPGGKAKTSVGALCPLQVSAWILLGLVPLTNNYGVVNASTSDLVTILALALYTCLISISGLAYLEWLIIG